MITHEILTSKPYGRWAMSMSGNETWIRTEKPAAEYGPINTAFETWDIYWQGQVVNTAHGDAAEAERVYAEERRARLEDADIDAHQDIPFSELPDEYFKNGDCPRLDTFWNVQSAGVRYSVSRKGTVTFND